MCVNFEIASFTSVCVSMSTNSHTNACFSYNLASVVVSVNKCRVLKEIK